MYDLVIVGGGVSGLYIYYKLINSNPCMNILLLEKNKQIGGRIQQYTNKKHCISFPKGASRFNVNHERVVKLLKEFNLLDFRKDKGKIPHTIFIDTKSKFNTRKFKNKTGFDYISIVLKNTEAHGITGTQGDKLRTHSFKTFAAKCLSQVEINFILEASGYSGQLKNMNMYDAYFLFKYGINVADKFYSGYFHLLIAKLEENIKCSCGKIKLDTKVNKIDYNKDCYEIKIKNKGRTKNYKAKKIVFCIPQSNLLDIPILNPIRKQLDSVYTKSLCRLYIKLDPVSEHKVLEKIKHIDSKIVTNNPLRHIIPIDIQKGIILIYTDDVYCKYWKNMSKLDMIPVYINQVFKIKIKTIEDTWMFYWENGVSYWKPKINSKDMYSFMLNPKLTSHPELDNIYICGESFSLTQSWVEGALETCDDFIKHVL